MLAPMLAGLATCIAPILIGLLIFLLIPEEVRRAVAPSHAQDKNLCQPK
jgi:hypothetical protein